MNTKYVFEFTQIAYYGSFSEAANELFISQSSLSKHMRSLEDQLGIQLFDRTTRKVRITPAGLTFLPFAEAICETESEALKALRDFRHNGKKLKIGNLPVMAIYGILSDISVFQKLHADIDIEIIEHGGDVLSTVKSLMDRNFELVFYDDSLVKSNPDIEAIHYCDDRLVVAIHDGHPLAKKDRIDISLLCNEKLMFFDKTTPIYEIAYNLCMNAGFKPNIIFLGTRMENMMELVSLNMGIALVLKKHTLHSFVDNVVIREVEPTATRNVVLAHVKNRRLSREAVTFRNYILSLSKHKADNANVG